MRSFPDSLHICAYDVRGTSTATGQLNPNRESGLVTRTHHLLRGLAQRHPDTRIALTKTGAAVPGPAYELCTPEGLVVAVREIATVFPQYLHKAGRKSHRLVRQYYEDTINDPGNPVWRSLAEQYARAIHAAGTTHVLAQSINPLISLLKAEEYMLLNRFHLTGVINDSGAEFARRFGYLAQRIHAEAELSLIAVSESVRRELIDAGVPGHTVSKVLNGLDVAAFQTLLRQVDGGGVWERVRARNALPADCRIVLVSARRVRWKGHEDVIRAARHLADCGQLDGVCIVINGAGMFDTRAPDYERHLEALIADLRLAGKVFLLDDLTRDEVAACYAGAHVAVHPSRKPEPFGYANVEAMLAGIPVIATRHGGPLEYIEHGRSGLLVPPYAPAAIAAELEHLLGDDALHARIGEASRHSAERFTLDAMVDGYEAAITTPRRVGA